MESSNEYTEEFLERFSALLQEAESILFQTERKGIFALPIKDSWPKVRQFLYRLTFPYFYIARRESFLYLLVAFFLLVSSVSTLSLARVVAAQPQLRLTQLWLAQLALLLLLGCLSWAEFLQDIRYPVWIRIWMLPCFVLACTLTGASFFPGPDSQQHVVSSLSAFVRVGILTVFALTPAFFFVFYTAVRVLWSYIALLRSTRAMQNPILVAQIRDLLKRRIEPRSSAMRSWHLLELPEVELAHLRRWAEFNRLSSENRTTPTLVVIGLVGLLIGSDRLSGVFGWLFTALNGGPSLPWFGAYLLLIGIAGFILIFTESMLGLFRNIACQSLIVEACLVAEYAYRKHQAEDNLRLRLRSIVRRFLAWLF